MFLSFQWKREYETVGLGREGTRLYLHVALRNGKG